MNEKVVFISHCSKDAEFAQKVCAVMESNNLPCWIAPRDIPYGNYWCEEITVAISKSKVMLYIHTENSNSKYDQVIREIHQAIKNGIPVIPIRLTTDNYTAALDYLISLNHWLRIDKKIVSIQLTELARRITLFINDTDYIPDTFYNKYFENLDLAINESVNIDKEFMSNRSAFAIFDSSEKKAKTKKVKNDFRNKLIQRAGETTLKKLFKEDCNSKFYEDTEEDLSDNTFSDDNNYLDDKGRYFYCYNEKNTDTLAFLISYIINEEDYTCTMVTTPIDREIEESENGDKYICFFIDNTDYEGNPIALAIIDNDKNIVTWGIGFLDNDTLKISNTPANISEINVSNDNNKTFVRYGANKHGVIILDIETHKVIERKRYYDKTSGKWKYYVELLNNNKYFLFEPRFASKKSPAQPFNIGYGYYKGKYGLRRNVIDAATWFEKAGTKEAYYYLAEIFKNDPILKNEDDYEYYMNLYNKIKK